MLKSLTDLSADSVKKAVSSAIDKMDGALHRQFRVHRRENRMAIRPGVVGINDPNGQIIGPPQLVNGRGMMMFGQQVPGPVMKQIQSERISIDADQVLSYEPDEKSLPGMYIADKCLQPESCDYFEVEILDSGLSGDIAVGLVPWNHPLDQLPGFVAGSVGYHAGDGKVYFGHQRGNVVGNKCEPGDRIGCGIRLETPSHPSSWARAVNKANLLPFLATVKLRVFFTLNGSEITSTLVTPILLRGGLYPAVALSSPGEEVKLSTNVQYLPPAAPASSFEDSVMCVDGFEDDWMRLHEMRLNGNILEYAGRGKSVLDVGLAQARKALDISNHYFEIEIIDPGENCYIAIGLTKKEYPHTSHPGWNKGSIAYHADDGKIFMGNGGGDPFGPRCHRGDVMGCGIIFPRDYTDSQKKSSFPRQGQQVESLSEDAAASELSDQEEEEDLELFDSDEEDSNGIVLQDINRAEQLASHLAQGFPIHPRGIIRGSPRYEVVNRQIQPERKEDEVECGPGVQVFFSRNGSMIGSKEISIPKGGFFPTVGMLSTAEKVRVDLHPFSG